MTVRARQLPVLALVVAAVAALVLSLTVTPRAGAIVSTNPDDGTCQTNGRVNAAVYLGGTIYLGGSFTSVDGTTRNRLAACDAATGNLLGWNPNANGVVRALKVSPAGTRVYVGGDFNSAEGAGRSRLAAFNATSGNISSTFKPTISNGAGNFATVLSMAVSPNNQSLYFSGDFALVNGHSRRNAAAVSTGIASLRAWNPASTGDIAGELIISASGNTVFVGGRATGGYVQAYGPNTGGTPVWNVKTNGDVEALAVSSSILYIGGHFTLVGAASRGHLAALTASGGSLQSWAPTANGVFGAFAAAITSSRVAFGGEFTTVAGEAHQGLVQFSGTP
jgi:hypothetical protein